MFVSTNLCFYKVSRIEERLPKTINLDDYNYSDNRFPYEYVKINEAQDWQKDIGKLKTIEMTQVDMFDAAEKILGKRPTSAQYCHNHGGERFFDAEGNELGEVTPEQFGPYRYKNTFQAYVYNSDCVGDVENAYDIPIKEGILTYDELINAVMNIIKEEDEFYSYIGEKIWGILKAAEAIKDGGTVYARYE